MNPYETVLENLEYKLQQELGLSDSEFLELKKGTLEMDFKTAKSLEEFIGGAKTFWTNLYNHRPSGSGKLK